MTPGIPDEYFTRSLEVPMTKEEIRALTVSKLQLFSNAVIYDIGAGSGSISIECALISNKGKVYALERKEEAVEIIKKNKANFGVKNIEVILDKAPSGMFDLPAADRIFIGGSGGELEEILMESKNKLKKQGRLVVNSVTLETGPKVISFMENNNFSNIDICQINIAKANTRGKVYLWQSRNPVQIISGVRSD
jgi:cobalt-precorrin-6B (C15)-methyltransferase